MTQPRVWHAVAVQGFEVRLFCRSLAKAEEMFGPDGATVDIVLGDVRNAQSLAEAAKGCQAAVWCAGSGTVLFGGNTYKEVSQHAERQGCPGLPSASVECAVRASLDSVKHTMQQ